MYVLLGASVFRLRVRAADASLEGRQWAFNPLQDHPGRGLVLTQGRIRGKLCLSNDLSIWLLGHVTFSSQNNSHSNLLLKSIKALISPNILIHFTFQWDNECIFNYLICEII